MIHPFSTDENEGLAKNLSFATAAQSLGLLSSIVMSLVVPKMVGVEDYAYWQLFMLYTTYSGLALLGVNDGIYLRLGGRRYTELDAGRLKAQIVMVSVFQILVSSCCFAFVLAIDLDSSRRFVLVFAILYGLIANLTSCLRYVFQSTNLTQISSIADLVARVSFLACVVGILLCGGSISSLFVVFYTVCQLLGLAYIAICARRIIMSRSEWTGVLHVCLADIVSGIKITIAYYADLLIVGITRMMVDWRLGLNTFGKISFSFSMTNFVLVFIGQVSMVVFPVLRRLSFTEQNEKYIQIRAALNVILPAVYLLYVPIRTILGIWLPQYEESLLYLALTMPLCIYSCKANFLFNTYLKVGRREGVLCLVNVLTMLVNAGLSVLAVLVAESVEWASAGIVLSVATRDFIFERYMAREFGLTYLRISISELLLSVSFMMVSWTLGACSWFVVAGLLAIYLTINRAETLMVILGLKAKLLRRTEEDA